jgi:DNA-binding SARP family transcriptional activator/Tfp pilus assembly protein PilF
VLDIRLLGPPIIHIDGSPLQVDTRKAIALLAYLTIEGEATRDSIAAVFWGDSPDERARASLRRTLSSLRSGVGGDPLFADRLRVGLADTIESDTRIFEDELQATHNHGHPTSDVCTNCIPHLQRATDLYRGDFLAGFMVRDAPDFEDWARTVGENFRLRAGEAFQRLGAAYAVEGNYSRAIKAVTRWADLDPLHEPAHRYLMLLNAWAGDRPSAVSTYRHFAAVLDSELGVPPLEETTELYEAILDEDLPPAPGTRRQPRSAGRPNAPTETAMLGRTGELDMLLDLATEERKTGALVLLEGTAWMGKTRLIEEFAAVREKVGDLIVIARSFRMENNLPYGVAGQILKGVSGPLIEYSGHAAPWALREAARIFPALWPELPEPATKDLEPLHVLEAVEHLLTIVGTNRPTSIIVEDLQWIDQASSELLLYLANRLAQIPILLIVTKRTGEELSQTTRALIALASHHIALEPLDSSNFDPGSKDLQEIESMLERTGGVPMLVVEELSGSGAHQGVNRYMEASLGALSDLARQILGAASAMTGFCTPELLIEISGRTETEFVEGVEELLRSGILREISGTGTFDFTLDSMRETVYNANSLVRRRNLHRRIAVALSSSHRAIGDARLAGTVASQFHKAGDEASAAQWYRTAADQARGMYAYAEAMQFLESALALGDTDVSEIRFAMGEMAIARGQYQEAISHLTIATTSATDSELALVEHRLGQANRMLGRFTAAEANYETAAPAHPEPADLYSDWALLLDRRGDKAEANRMAKKALAALKTSKNSRMESRVYNISAVISEDTDSALEYLEKAMASNTDREPVSKMATLNNRAHLLSAQGKQEEAIAVLEEAIGIASETGYRHREAALLSHLADCHHRMGDRATAEITQARAIELFADIDSGQWEPEVWLVTRW